MQTVHTKTLHLLSSSYQYPLPILYIILLVFPASLFAQIPNYDDLPNEIPTVNWQTLTEQQISPDETLHFEITPARYKKITEQIMIKEDYNGFREPVYQTVTETVKIKEMATKIITIPYESYVEKIPTLLKPEHIILRKKGKPHPFTESCYDKNGIGIDTCHWEYVTIPAQYVQQKVVRVSRQTMTETLVIPPEYKEIEVQRIDKEATAKNKKRLKRYQIEAEFQTIEVMVLEQEASAKEVVIPISIGTITSYHPSDTPINLDRLRKPGAKSSTIQEIIPKNTPEIEETERSEKDKSGKAPPPPPKAAPRPSSPPSSVVEDVKREYMKEASSKVVYDRNAKPKATRTYGRSGSSKINHATISSTAPFSEMSPSPTPSLPTMPPPPPPPPSPPPPPPSMYEPPLAEPAPEGMAIEATIEDAEMPHSIASPREIHAGTLTAGEINDFSKWDMWEDISSIILQQWQQRWQLNPLERYSVQLTYEDGNPVVDRLVEVTDNKGKSWKARTDNTGKAELWGHAFGETYQALANPTIKVNQGGKMRKLPSKATAFANGMNSLQVKGNCDYSDQLDVLFVVDATGSMKDEIAYLQVELNDVISQVQANQPDLNINLGSLFYRDHSDEYLTRKSDFSTDISQTTDFIKAQSADGGGDKPEAVEIALEEALQLSWSKEARTRLLFLVLDASPRENDDVRKSLDASIRKAAEMGIKIIPIAGSGINKGTEYLMRSMALLTNGRYVFLTDHSMVGGKHIAPTTDTYEMEFFNDLLIRIIEESVTIPSCGLEAKTNTPKEDVPDKVVKKDDDKTKKDPDKKVNIAKVYPNPATDFVQFESTTEVAELLLTDLTGKIIQRWTKVPAGVQKIDLVQFPVGVYFVKYQVDDVWKMEKVLVTRN